MLVAVIEESVGALAGAPVRHLSLRHADFARGLYSLPDDLPLTELRSLLGISRWPSLTTVTVNGMPTADEIRELGQLPNLRWLDLYGVSETDVESAYDAVQRLDGVEVHTTPQVLTIATPHQMVHRPSGGLNIR